MPVRGTIQYKDWPDLSKRAVRAAVRKELQASVEEWHDETLPKHFEYGAGSRWKYQRRDPRYLARKRRRRGHTRPLVFSGTLRKQVTRRVRVTGTFKKATGTMIVPPYLYKMVRRRGGTLSPDKHAELIAVTESEVKKMAKRFGERTQERIFQKETKSKTVRV